MPDQQDDRLLRQLGHIRTDALAIADSTAAATDAILAICDRLRESHAANDALIAEILAIYQTCAVQDLTNQRVQKILRHAARIENPALPDDDELLEGPQAQGGGVDQDEINRLLGETE